MDVEQKWLKLKFVQVPLFPMLPYGVLWCPECGQTSVHSQRIDQTQRIYRRNTLVTSGDALCD